MINTKKILLLISFCFLTELTIKAQAIVYVEPPTKEITFETTTTINIRIEGAVDLKAYSVKLKFDNSLCSVNRILKKTFLTNSGANQTLINSQPSNSNIVDEVTINEAILPSFPSGNINTVAGSGILFSIEFEIVEAGNCPIIIEEVILKDSSNNNISNEYESGTIKILLPLKVKVFLEGSFENGFMNTSLCRSGKLPFAQPYSDEPWNYTGNEKLPLDFFEIHENIVDWVIVELRSAENVGTKLHQYAALLLDNGEVTGLNGISPLFIKNGSSEYYVVIKHRNHLSIISKTAINISRNSSQINFTESQESAFGSNPMAELEGNNFGMYAGDINADGEITGTDYNLFSPGYRSAASGYNTADLNLDGTITGTDFNLFNPNFRKGKTSFVPE